MREHDRDRREGKEPREPSRRELLAGGLALATCGPLALAGAAPARRARLDPARLGPARLGTVLGGGLVEIGQDQRNVFCMLDLDPPGARQRLVTLDFYGHGLALDPLDPARAILFEKNGKGACELDLAAGAVVGPLATAAERDFYGHGAFAPDGSLLYATESVVADRYRGVIVVRDGRTLEELGLFPSYGVRPHDCVLRDGGRTLVVTNGGERSPADGTPPCVSYVDVASERLIERVDVPSPDLNAGHLALSARGDLAVVSAAAGGVGRDGLGAVSFRPSGAGGDGAGAGALRVAEDPLEVTGRLRGEALSVAIHEPSGVAGITSPFASLVTFWDVHSGRFLRALDLAAPRGIALALDGSRFVVSYGRSASLLAISTDTLEPLAGSRREQLNLFGSHIAVHSLARAQST